MTLLGFDFNAFPKLRFNTRIGDIMSACFNDWLSSFRICVEMTTLKLGNETGTDANAGEPKFRGRIKMLSLLHAIGREGLRALEASGYDHEDENATYDLALQRLREIYQRTESLYIKIARLISARQLIDEDEVNYYRRIDSLSRKLGWEDNVAREALALSTAVCGLRDLDLRRTLLADADLTWEQFLVRCKNKVSAVESEQYLTTAASSSTIGYKKEIKQEIDMIDSSISKDKTRKMYSNADHSESQDSYDEGLVFQVTRSRNKSSKSRRYSRSRSRSTSSSNDSSVPEWRKPVSRRNSNNSNRCHGCKKPGHYFRECPRVKCYVCQKRGHTSIDCSKNKRYSSSNRYYKRDSSSDRSDNGRKSKSPSRMVRFAKSDCGK